jgi:hypothetical protein
MPSDEPAPDLDTSPDRINRLLGVDRSGRLRGKCSDSPDDDTLWSTEIRLGLDSLLHWRRNSRK